MNTLSSAPPWDMVAYGYATSAMDFFQQFSAAALNIVPVQSGDCIADIACGPGTLALQAAQTGAQISAVDFSVNMLAQLEQAVADLEIENLEVIHGDGQRLLFEDDTFDAAFSMFALMFYPDRKAGFRELFRIVRPGGAATVATFSSIEKSPLLRQIFAVTRAMLPDQPAQTYDVDSLENPKTLMAEMTEAGFKNVKIHPVVRELEFASAEQFVKRMAEGSAPLHLLRIRMSEDQWQERLSQAIEQLNWDAGPFPRKLSATALLAVGYK
ncbi:MAG: methyltransferase domain-containing protein [Erythrobacter sp.]